MPLQNDIETIVGLIETDRIDQAVAVWAEIRDIKSCCTPCFYAPLDINVRCASCLESNLDTALLKRAYTKIPHDRLQKARSTLSEWICAPTMEQPA